MAYRPFYEAVADLPPATFATVATVRPKNTPSVANVASVAGPPSETGEANERAERQYAFEERAAILEYDCGLPRTEAERRAHLQTSPTLH